MQEILFEHPLNERTRTLLRLSHLFRQFEHHSIGESSWQSRAAVHALLDIAAILSRPDIKSEMIKQLDQHAVKLRNIARNPNVDPKRLERVLRDLENSSQCLKSIKGQLGNQLRRSEFLTSIAQRLAIPGGSFEFDLPQFHHWLHLPFEKRHDCLQAWHREIAPVQNIVELLLGVLRNSNVGRQVTAQKGLYSKNLDPQRPTELIQISIDADLNVFAEISGSKHRFCVRFMETDDWDHPQKSERDIPFKLNICIL